jgi:hypothetical protein
VLVETECVLLIEKKNILYLHDFFFDILLKILPSLKQRNLSVFLFAISLFSFLINICLMRKMLPTIYVDRKLSVDK